MSSQIQIQNKDQVGFGRSMVAVGNPYVPAIYTGLQQDSFNYTGVTGQEKPAFHGNVLQRAWQNVTYETKSFFRDIGLLPGRFWNKFRYGFEGPPREMLGAAPDMDIYGAMDPGSGHIALPDLTIDNPFFAKSGLLSANLSQGATGIILD